MKSYHQYQKRCVKSKACHKFVLFLSQTEKQQIFKTLQFSKDEEGVKGEIIV
jgi:hypothetical protein